MKDKFPEFFALSEGDFKHLWDEAFIILDTNVLLRLFRYKEKTASEILETLESLSSRVWIPYQVGWEYNRRRLEKIQESTKFYTTIVEGFRRAADTAEKNLQDHKDFGIHPTINLEEKIRELSEFVRLSIDKIIDQYKLNSTIEHYNSIHDRIANIYSGKIGEEPNEEEIANLTSAGEARYAKKTPPGTRDVEDKKKRGQSDREVYGDYLIWKEIIDYARQNKKPVIFVTEDAKDDWWLREDGQTIGPLPALRREFIRETSCIIHFYRLEGFLKQAKDRIKANISKESVEEVVERSNIDDIRDKLDAIKQNIYKLKEEDKSKIVLKRSNPEISSFGSWQFISPQKDVVEFLKRQIHVTRILLSTKFEEMDNFERHFENISSGNSTEITNSDRMMEYVHASDRLKSLRREYDETKSNLHDLERRLSFLILSSDLNANSDSDE